MLAVLLGPSARAQEKTSEIDKLFSWATPENPGCVCAVSQNGQMVVNRAYGAADLERRTPLTTNSVFDAGSLVKQFVAAATLLLVADGKLSLADNIRKHLPQIPDYGHKITIDHLLTHTSGIRDWTGIMPLTSTPTDALTITLRQRGLNFIPGEEWSYSNVGYVLLKEIVARVSGQSFSEFTRKRLFEPLGMNHTAYRTDLRAVVKDRALAYDKERGGWKMAMLLDNERGGGGALLSTPADLLIWNEALTNRRLSAYVTEKIQEPARLNNGRQLGYARGLFVDTNRGGRFWWHSGSADGYKSVLARFPEQGLSVAIMCNSGDETDRVAFVRSIFDLFVPATGGVPARNSTPPPVAEGIDTARLDLNSRTGLFFSETTGAPLRLVVMNGGLRVAGGPALVATAPDRFKRWGTDLNFMSNDAFELQFRSENLLEMRSMEGSITRYRRAQPFTPNAEALKGYEGRYESTEIGTVLQVAHAGAGLVMRMEHAPARSLELKPIDGDTFQFSRMTLRFQRDKDGKVIGFTYSNPLLQNVPFTRLAEQPTSR